MTYRRILAIGDIHGHFEKFHSAYAKMHFEPADDLLVFLGDYIDRGPSVRRTLEFVMKLAVEKTVVLLRGNHEQMMLDYFFGGATGESWLMNGGKETMAELLAWEKESPGAVARVLAFLRGLPLSHSIEQDGQRYFFAHAGVRPGIALEKQRAEDLLWIREEFYRHYAGDAIVVAGHTPTLFLDAKAKPLFINKHIILVDTGSYFPDGHISIVDVLSRRFWQNAA
ncbi:metallophosphoesterase family protein [uncultured Selenomonas sp.]|uniref:metallophosphoesterase family protein n=1 Tax=uncultured Selenomonas sp. TaxID=159275 RepID=UPI0028DCF144|nr:metallophosphoesterase family protein [uncultured Selenomonas sp.]